MTSFIWTCINIHTLQLLKHILKWLNNIYNIFRYIYIYTNDTSIVLDRFQMRILDLRSHVKILIQQIVLEQTESTWRSSERINPNNFEDFTLSITVPYMFKGRMGEGLFWKVKIISFILVPLILVLFSSVCLTTLSEVSCLLDYAGLSMTIYELIAHLAFRIVIRSVIVKINIKYTRYII